MKKIISLVAMLLLVISASAQDEKRTLVVEKFTNKSNTNDITVNNLRQEIITGIAGTKRVEIKDATAYDGDASVPKGKRERIKFFSGQGFNYMLEGTLNSVDQKSATTSKGNTQYEATVNYTLTLTDLETGIVKSTETYKDSYTIGDTADEAVLKAIEYATGRMKKYVNDNFKVDAIVKSLDEIDQKKNAVKSCYVSVGTGAGVEKGQIFEVFAEIEIAGETAQKKIGELKADEVMSATLTHCSVKSGGPEIKKYFDDQKKLIVVSRAKKEVLGTFGRNLGKNLGI